MIVLVNGPFGVGKTAASRALAAYLSATLYDPERIGFVLHRLWPAGDYQDLALWRRLTVAGARLARLRRERLVVPMTLWRRAYFAEIVRGFRRVDPSVHVFRLTAEADVLRTRILGSREGQQWRLGHLTEGLSTFSDPYFGVEVRTDGKQPAEIALEICEELL
jgi:hypothetical protein